MELNIGGSTVNDDQVLGQIRKLWAKLERRGRERHLTWTLSQCATCGRRGQADGNGVFCDACCEEALDN